MFKNIERLERKRKWEDKKKQKVTVESDHKKRRVEVALEKELERRWIELGVEAMDSFDDEFHQIVFPVGDPEIAKFWKWEAS